MRVIAGHYKGRRLRPVVGGDVRSTGDRVKESLFNILAVDVEDTDVLDLFCGAGTLGIEALSRGARRATFVDIARRSIQRTRENCETIGAADDAVLITHDAIKTLRNLDPKKGLYSLILADPPYREGLVAKLLKEIPVCAALAKSGILVIEHHKKELPDHTPEGFSLWTQRQFGDTMFTIWCWGEADEPPDSAPEISAGDE